MEGHYDRAAQLFLQIAHGPTSALSAQAGELAFDSIALLGNGARPPRPGCFDLLARELPQLLDKFCSPAGAPGAKKLCAVLYSADVDMTRCSECTTGSLSGRDPRWEQLTSAQLFVDTAREQCVFGRGSEEINATHRCDELLFSAYRMYRDAGAEAQAREVKRMLLDPTNGLQQTDSARRLK